MPIDESESMFEPFVGGEAEMRTGGRAYWRCEVTRFLVNSYWLVAHVAWLAMNRGDDKNERWEKFQHPEFIVSFWNYHRPELIRSGDGRESYLRLRHRSENQVILLHPPDGERLDPAIVAPIRATFVTHSDPPRYM